MAFVSNCSYIRYKSYGSQNTFTNCLHSSCNNNNNNNSIDTPQNFRIFYEPGGYLEYAHSDCLICIQGLKNSRKYRIRKMTSLAIIQTKSGESNKTHLPTNQTPSPNLNSQTPLKLLSGHSIVFAGMGERLRIRGSETGLCEAPFNLTCYNTAALTPMVSNGSCRHSLYCSKF